MNSAAQGLVLFGVHPVLEKLEASPEEVLEVLLPDGPRRPALRSIEEKARRLGRPLRYVSPGVLDRLVDGRRHQGVVAKVAAFSYHDFSDLLRSLPSGPWSDWILALDGLTDPHNFGALLRCAEAVGIRHVLIGKDRSVGVTPVVVKSSAGAVHHLAIYQVTNLWRALSALKEKGYWLVGLDEAAKEDIYVRSYPERLVVVLGAEGAGIRRLIRQECDFLVTIPMRGKITSLNVAVAGGVFLYELLRQRRAGEEAGCY